MPRTEQTRRRTADAIVIGAGILGGSVAFSLANEGLRVVILERGAANRQGSGTTAGNLHIQAPHTRRPGQATPLDRDRFIPLQRAVSPMWDDLGSVLDADIELRRDGGFMIATTPAQVADLELKQRAEAEFGVPTQILDGESVRSEAPYLAEGVLAASWCPWDGYANPLKVTPAWLAAAGRLNASLQLDTEVRGIRRDGDCWSVDTSQGTWIAPVVVNAAGPWLARVAELAGIRINYESLAIQMHATVRVRHMLDHLIQHVGEGLSVKQVNSGQILIGGGWPAASFSADGRSDVSLASMAGNLRQATRVMPFLADLRLLRSWAGPIGTAPDEMPVIGPVPGRPGLFAVGGTYAFTFAPLWGRVMADLVLGRAPHVEVGDLSVDRLLRGAE